MKFRDQYRTVVRTEAVDIAQRVLVAEGDSALTMRRVSEELGLSASAIYRYFDSRDDLIASVWRRRLGDLGKRLAAPSPATADAPVAIDAMVATWVDAGGRDPLALVRIADHLDDAAGPRAGGDTDVDPPADAEVAEVAGLAAPLVDALAASGASPVDDTRSRSTTQAAVILRTIAAVCAQPDADPPDTELAQRAVTALLEVWAER